MLARRARTSKSWDHVFNFRTCDVALSSLITFNRADASTCATRRRAFGAVGPSRTNDLTYSGVFSDAAWTKTNVTLTAGVADPRGGTTAFTLTAGASAPRQLTQALSAGASLERVNSLWLRRRTGAGNVKLWSPDVGTPLVISALPSTWTRYEVANASASTTRTLLLELTVTGDEVDIWEGQLELGRSATPNIPTTSAPVTTTDWPRTNYIAKSNKFSSALWGRNATGTGVPPAVVSEVVPSPSGSLDATRITFDLGAGDTLGDQSSLNLYRDFGLIPGANYCAGIWAKIPVGVTLAVRTVGANYYLALVGTGQWKRYPRPEVAGITYAYLDICLRGGLGIGASTGRVTVDLWHCTLEEGSALTATIPNDTAAPLTVNTPPFGQMTTVAANVPQLEYDADGIGRGLRVDGAFTTTINYTEQLEAVQWLKSSVVAGAGDFSAHNVRGYATRLVGGGVNTLHETYSNSSTVAAGVPLRVVAKADGWSHLVVGLYDGGDKSNVCFNLANGTVGSVWAGAPASAYSITALEDGWYECSVTPSAGGFPTLFLSAQNADSRMACYSTGDGVTTAVQVARVHTGQGGYLAAEGSAVTRAAASALMVPSAVGLTPTSGSILIDCDVNNADSILWHLGSTGSDRLLLYCNGTFLKVYSMRAGVEELPGPVIGSLGGNRARVAVAWASGKIYASVNGGEPSIFNAGVPTSFVDLALSYYPYGGGYQIDGVIRELRTASRTLTIAELVRETAL